jgi:hypothetical protein
LSNCYIIKIEYSGALQSLTSEEYKLDLKNIGQGMVIKLTGLNDKHPWYRPNK